MTATARRDWVPKHCEDYVQRLATPELARLRTGFERLYFDCGSAA